MDNNTVTESIPILLDNNKISNTYSMDNYILHKKN